MAGQARQRRRRPVRCRGRWPPCCSSCWRCCRWPRPARSIGTPDLAAYTQASWLIRHGHDPVTTVTTGTNVFAQQGAFAFYPLAQLSRTIPAIPLLLTVQSLALALTVVPLWRVARRLANLRAGAALIVLLVFAVYPIVQTLNLDGFHPETLALPFLVGAGLLRAVPALAPLRPVLRCIAVLCRADLGLAVAGLGVLLVVQGHRRRGAHHRGGRHVWALGLPVRASSPTSATPGSPSWAPTPPTATRRCRWRGACCRDPARVLGNVFNQENFRLMVYLFAPVLFLPFLSPRYLLPVVPLQLVYLAGNVSQATRYGPQAVAITAFIFLATPMGLARLGRRSVEKVTVDRRVLITVVLACLSFYVLIAPELALRASRGTGAAGTRSTAPGSRPVTRSPRDAAVRASSSMLTLLAQRQTLYPLDADGVRDPGRGPRRSPPRGVDVIIVDRHDLGSTSPSAHARTAFEAGGHQARGSPVMSDDLGIVVLRR